MWAKFVCHIGVQIWLTGHVIQILAGILDFTLIRQILFQLLTVKFKLSRLVRFGSTIYFSLKATVALECVSLYI